MSERSEPTTHQIPGLERAGRPSQGRVAQRGSSSMIVFYVP
jgi:hypothetical protein